MYAQDIIALTEQAETMSLSEEALHFLNLEVNVSENIYQLWSLSDACLLSQILTEKAEMWLKVSRIFCDFHIFTLFWIVELG